MVTPLLMPFMPVTYHCDLMSFQMKKMMMNVKLTRTAKSSKYVLHGDRMDNAFASMVSSSEMDSYVHVSYNIIAQSNIL